ncbi:MAG: DUF2905 domain-containing protein [Nitrospiraceae bacterium]
MTEWGAIGKTLMVVGIGIALVGALLNLSGRIPGLTQGWGWLGKLPGDLSIEREHVRVYFPIATSLVISVVLSLVLYLLSWLFRR